LAVVKVTRRIKAAGTLKEGANVSLALLQLFHSQSEPRAPSAAILASVHLFRLTRPKTKQMRSVSHHDTHWTYHLLVGASQITAGYADQAPRLQILVLACMQATSAMRPLQVVSRDLTPPVNFPSFQRTLLGPHCITNQMVYCANRLYSPKRRRHFVLSLPRCR
jgi:hypothetical protein